MKKIRIVAATLIATCAFGYAIANNSTQVKVKPDKVSAVSDTVPTPTRKSKTTPMPNPSPTPVPTPTPTPTPAPTPVPPTAPPALN